MKPFDASELSIPCDLSQCALEDALSDMRRRAGKDALCYDRIELTVGIGADLLAVIDLSRGHGLRPSFSRTYEDHEWSVTVHTKEGYKPITVWSSGA